MIIKNFYGGELSACRRFFMLLRISRFPYPITRRFARQKTRRLIWLTFPLFPALRPAHYDAVRRMRATYARINKRRKRAGADKQAARRAKNRRRGRFNRFFTDGSCGAARGRMYRKTQKRCGGKSHMTFAAALLSYLRLRRYFGIHALFKERTLRTRRTTKNIHTPSPARNTTSMPTMIHTHVYVSFTEHTVMSTGSPPASSLARSVDT